MFFAYLHLGLIPKSLNAKLFNINILKPSDMHTYVCVSGGYSTLIFESFSLRKFLMSSHANQEEKPSLKN